MSFKHCFSQKAAALVSGLLSLTLAACAAPSGPSDAAADLTPQLPAVSYSPAAMTPQPSISISEAPLSESTPEPSFSASPSPTPEPTAAASPTPAPTASASPVPTAYITPAPTVTASPVPTPEPTAAQQQSGSLNHFAIPAAIKSRLTAADTAAYSAIVEAYLNYESFAVFSAPDDISDLKYLLELCFPVFYSDVDESSIKFGSGRVDWTYTVSEAEHRAIIEKFNSVVSNFLSGLRGSDSTVMRCLVLYNALIRSITYDYNTSDYYDGVRPNFDGKLYDHCCDALLYGRGICWCFGRSYAYLLNQIGVEALTVCADGGVGHHEWTLFKLDGKWYYADPTWDDPQSVLYFGFTSNARRSSGYTVENSRYFAGADHPISGVFDVSDMRFSDLFTGRCYGDYYVLDRAGNKILFYSYDDSETPCSIFDLD